MNDYNLMELIPEAELLQTGSRVMLRHESILTEKTATVVGCGEADGRKTYIFASAPDKDSQRNIFYAGTDNSLDYVEAVADRDFHVELKGDYPHVRYKTSIGGPTVMNPSMREDFYAIKAIIDGPENVILKN